jgi:regulator of CtrA degradation
LRFGYRIGMSEPATINPRIIEGLYSEALVLSDEVRAAFRCPAWLTAAPMTRTCAHRAVVRGAAHDDADDARGRLAAQPPRLFPGRTVRIPAAPPRQAVTSDLSGIADPERLALLRPIRELIAATERFYARPSAARQGLAR